MVCIYVFITFCELLTRCLIQSVYSAIKSFKLPLVCSFRDPFVEDWKWFNGGNAECLLVF